MKTKARLAQLERMAKEAKKTEKPSIKYIEVINPHTGEVAETYILPWWKDYNEHQNKVGPTETGRG